MNIVEVLYDTPLYRKVLTFRYTHLREPLGLKWSREDLEAEDRQFHYIAQEGEEMLGCVVFKPLDKSRVLLRQMAVASHCRGQGIGAALLQECFVRMKEKRYVHIVSHVRESAEGFYAKLGFAPEGEYFIQATLPTIRMIRAL